MPHSKHTLFECHYKQTSLDKSVNGFKDWLISLCPVEDSLHPSMRHVKTGAKDNSAKNGAARL